MQWFKKSALAAALLFFLPLLGHTADDDGTFTITIQGPEVEDTDTRPRQNQNQNRRQQNQNTASQSNRNQQRQTAQNTPQSSSQPAQAPSNPQPAPAAPTVAAGTTYKVSAGQSIWSVAHSLVPVDKKVNEFQIIASIYRNNPDAFADHNVNSLIRGSTLRIPSLKEIALEDSNAGAILLKRGSYTLQPLNSSGKSSTGLDLNADEYTATETRIKELHAQQALKMDDPVVNRNDTRQADLQIPSETANAKKNLDDKLVAGNAQAVQDSVDAQAIRIMLDETKKSIDAKTRQLETQLAQAIERMKKSTAMTAQTSADSVSTLASQYDNIIAGIQQDIIELKGRLSKISQDNDRMREMLLANDEKLEDIQLQMTQYSVSTADANLELDKPVLMILFGSGLLTLVLIILVIIFKMRTRARQRSMSDEFDFDESVPDDVLLSDADGSIDLETPVGDDDEDDGAKTENGGTPNANAIDAPSEDPAKVVASMDASADSAQSSDEKKAQEEWDKAASADSSGADDWAAALNEQAASEKKEEGSQSDMADAWAAALNEQESSEKKDEGSQEDMADAWAAALNEQESSEKKDEGSQEDMADAWAAALNEQENSESGKSSESPKSEEEAMADAWASALNEQEASESKSVDVPKSESTEEADLKNAMADSAPKEKPSTDDLLDALFAKEEAKNAVPVSSEDEEQKTEGDVPSEAKDFENALKQNDTSEYTEEVEIDEVTEKSAASDIAPDIDLADLKGSSKKKKSEPAAKPVKSESPSDDIDLDALTADSAASSDDIDLDALTADSAAPSDDIDLDALTADSAAPSDDADLDALTADSAAPSDDIDLDALTADSAAPSDDADLDALTADSAAPSDDIDLDALAADSAASDDAAQVESSAETEAVSEDEVSEEVSVDDIASEDILQEETDFDAASEENMPSEENVSEDSGTEDLTADESVLQDMVEDDASMDDSVSAEDTSEVISPDYDTSDEPASDDLSGEAMSLAGAMNASYDETADDQEDYDEELDDTELTDDVSDSIADEFDSRTEDFADEGLSLNETSASDEVAELAQILESHNDGLEIKTDDDADVASSAQDSQELEALLASTEDGSAQVQEESAPEKDLSASDFESDNDNAVLSSDEEKAMLEALTGGDSGKKSSKSSDFTEDDFNIPNTDDSDAAPSIHEVVEDDLNLEQLLVEKAAEDEGASEDALSNIETVSWTVPDDESLESGSSAEQTEETSDDESDEEALKELEKRFTLSKNDYDAESESDLVNMLGASDDESTSLTDEDSASDEPFSADDIASMLSTAAVGDDTLEDLDEPVQHEAAAEEIPDEDTSLENVSDRIGPIEDEPSEDDIKADEADDNETLSPKEHQYYVDELNLATLYFETGDTEEALKIIDDVKSHGSADLIEEADKVMENYAN